MDTTWTVGLLPAGVENVQTVATGTEGTREEAIEAASGALVVAAIRSGRAEFRVSVADTRVIVVPGLTAHGEVDLYDLRDALWSVERVRAAEPPADV